MENKKKLIIIPPMSEAVKKLHEVLEGISSDENMEITLIDDLKELTQFLGNTGQCLILVSNAKKCATFLQENRNFLLKNHCKTILFTPKEIPPKTLIKFTKIGLTESILENSPPKTFLYKVKLLLRSIKTAKVVDDAEKTVKSLDNMKAVIDGDLEVKEKKVTEDNVIDMERQNKKDNDEGETIDYGNPLKGKVKPGEESIDTHWKSDRKKSTSAIDEEDEKDLTSDSTPDSIDLYMRGKNLKNQELPEEDDFDKKMAELLQAEEAAKKKSNFADVIDEGTMKQKRIKTEEIYAPEEEKKQNIELDITPAEKKKGKKDVVPEEDDFDKKMAELLAAEAEAKKKNEGFVEDLGGHMIGKLTSEKTPITEEEKKKEKKYDNSELFDEGPESIELDLIAAKKKEQKKNIEPDLEEGEIHEAEVDHIEGNMIGDESTVEKIRTRMEGRSSYEDTSLEDEAIELHTKKNKQIEEQDKEELDLNSLEITPAAKESKKREALRSDSDDKDYKEKSIELDLIAADKKSKQKVELEETSARERKSTDSEDSPEHHRKSMEKNPEAQTKERDFGPGQDVIKKDGNNVHNSSVDKIDTYYRGGEAAKKKDQDWGNLVDKHDSLDLLPGKGKRSDGSSEKGAKADLGEQTIDYRKMKEEFDQMAHGTSAEIAARSTEGNTTLKNNEDEGSFKVVEIDPKSLDFSIKIINCIYQKDIKAKQIFALLSDELVDNYHCYPIFYTYKLSDKKFTEVYNPFIEIKNDRMNKEKRAFWNEFKKDTALFEHFQEKSMTTWRCPEIVKNNEVWEDVELPNWAENELKSKKVELIFPYFDGIDRMGLALVLLPDGLDPKVANGLLTVLEMARSLFLDTIQRYQVQPLREDRNEPSSEAAPAEEKKNVLSFFGGLFGKKKVG